MFFKCPRISFSLIFNFDAISRSCSPESSMAWILFSIGKRGTDRSAERTTGLTGSLAAARSAVAFETTLERATSLAAGAADFSIAAAISAVALPRTSRTTTFRADGPATATGNPFFRSSATASFTAAFADSWTIRSSSSIFSSFLFTVLCLHPRPDPGISNGLFFSVILTTGTTEANSPFRISKRSGTLKIAELEENAL